MKPSEAIALRWSDVDLRAGSISITKSRYMETDSATKTSERTGDKVGEEIIKVLRSIKPLQVTGSEFVFKNLEGRPIREDKWRKKYW